VALQTKILNFALFEHINKSAMKKLFSTSLFFLAIAQINAQPCFDLGFKGGATLSELHFNNLNYSKENVLNYHIGAFSRIGWGRLFIQPEAYFNSRGGTLKSTGSIENSAVTNFDFTSVDVPVLGGIKLVKGNFFNLRAMAGPMLGFITSRDVEPSPEFSKAYFQDHLFGWQYGIGFDLWFLTLDARIEHSRNSIYQSSDFSTKNNVFLISAGIKIL